MQAINRPRHWRLLLMAVLIALWSPRAWSDGPETGSKEKEAPAATEAPVNIFVNGPTDLDEFWKRLARPDFILMRGDEFQKRLDQARAAAPGTSWAAVVNAVVVVGETVDDVADLSVEYRITLAASPPAWVSIRLDDQNLIEVREGERDPPIRYVAGTGWQVELSGQGVHRVRVGLKVRLKATSEGQRLGLAIPEVGQTRLQLDVPQRVADAVSGGSEPLAQSPIAGGQRTRLAADLTARPRLDVRWKFETEAAAQLPPLLSIQGEIAIDVGPGSFRTRSSWIIHSIRGTTRDLEFRLDPDDEVLELELDGQPSPPSSLERVEGATRLTIKLVDPLEAGARKKLLIATRRPIVATGAARLAFGGFPLATAREQSGAVGIAQTGDLSIHPTSGRGLRRIDPRELPADLRVRPGMVLAYSFVDQPFELNLRIEPSPPLVRVEARTTVGLSARQARVETWLDYRTARGRLFEFKVESPAELELESVGPEEIVESWERGRAPAEGADPSGTRALRIVLKPNARDQGGFSIRLVGRQAIDPSGPIAVGLFRPLEAISAGGRLAVVTERDLTVDPGEQRPGMTDEFRPGAQEPPTDWPWPSDRPAPGPPALWLRHDNTPAALPLRVTVYPKSVSHATVLNVQVERRGIEVQQATDCVVRFGTLDHLDVAVPSELRDRWEWDEGTAADRRDIGPSRDGGRLVRLKFARPVVDKVRLKLRYRLPMVDAPGPDRPTEIAVPWLRPREGTAGPTRVQLASEPGVGVESLGTNWRRLTADDPATLSDAGSSWRLELIHSGPDPSPLRIVATARPLTTLPAVVAARLLLRTVQGPDQGLRTTAWYWLEAHTEHFSVGLPPGAEWVRAKVGGELVGQVESLPKSVGYRLQVPSRFVGGPVLVELEYTIAGRFAAPPWTPPRLLDGGVVEETLWEVRLPWTRAVVGVPPGWTDENHWLWDRYVWMRRPWKDAEALAAWMTGPSGPGPTDLTFEEDARKDDHGYLFGRPGAPPALRVTIASRAGLVALCSGTVLALGGLLFLVWRPSPPLLIAVLALLAFAGATALEPSVAIQAAQSGLIGVALTLLAAVTQRLVERRGSAAVLFGEASGLVAPGPSPSGSAVNHPGVVGSEDSTAIRVRPTTLMDYVVTVAPQPPENGPGRGATAQPGS